MRFKNNAGDVVFTSDAVTFKDAAEEARRARVHGLCYIPLPDLCEADRTFLELGDATTVTIEAAQRAVMRLGFLVSR